MIANNPPNSSKIRFLVAKLVKENDEKPSLSTIKIFLTALI